MFRVTSLADMPEAQLNRWIRRLALLLVVGVLAFAAFYAADRYRPAAAPIIDRQLSALEDAVRKDPADITARGQLADHYLAANRYDDAIEQYTQILSTGKADEAAYVSRGRAYELKGDLDAAKTDYAKVVDLAKGGEMANVDQALEVAYFGLGAIALKQDDPTTAIDNLQRALAIRRTDADAMNLLGAAYVQAGQPDKAIEQLRKAILFVPAKWPDPYLTLAAAYKATGAPELADWATAMATLANGDSTSAEAMLRRLVDGKAAVDAEIGLGLVMEMRGDTAAAADWYRKAVALEPKNESALLGLSRVTDGSAHPSPAASQPAATPAEGSN